MCKTRDNIWLKYTDFKNNDKSNGSYFSSATIFNVCGREKLKLNQRKSRNDSDGGPDLTVTVTKWTKW